ncbi:MAG: DNA-directed RNA polymerase subunit beta [Armatimonadetes bacterium]|nr:DNA-directed RNA polymerase subunit beta [Armatimonadota bacterium]
MSVVDDVGRASPPDVAAVGDIPNLIEIQTESYRWFLDEGLRELFHNFSPIEDPTGTYALYLDDYLLKEAKYTIEECRDRDITYERPISARIRLLNKRTGEIMEDEVYLGDLPIMTDKGTFVINGAERVVVSQLARSPGVYFRDNIDYSGRVLFSAQVIPAEGAWIEVDTDANDVIYVRIGQTRKFPITTLLRALNAFDHEQQGGDRLQTATNIQLFRLFGTVRVVENPTRENLLGPDPNTPGPRVYEDITDPNNGRLLAKAFERIDRHLAEKIEEAGIQNLEIIEVPRYIEATLEQDPVTERDDTTRAEDEALLDIYRKVRPGDPATRESARALLSSVFFDIKRYDLARVGRHKLNKKLGIDLPLHVRSLTRDDLIAIVRYIIRLSHNEGGVDDIDHLENKRVRSVGELLQSQFRLGLLRMEKVAKERMTSLEPDAVSPQAVVSVKPISAAIKSFFGSSQLSQFMDQTNPLAELTHKRRLSALGPGGLSRQSAKLEVRDVHHSHYGRICPIETPEGPNIGLIGSMAMHARINEFGFLETPYRKVVNGKVTDQIDYLTADEEAPFHIAPSSAPLRDDGTFVGDTVVVRYRNDFPAVPPEQIDYMDVSPRQIVSVAAALIPFLENDDANRALMGSNMQRQAVPLLRSERPIVRTGVEYRAATDSGVVVRARNDGIVERVTAREITIRRRDGELDEYRLLHMLRSNQATCITQKPLVRVGERIRKGQVIADGPSTDGGHLALGKNVLVAFMPWEGYNYEDAILLSERLVKDDVYTSIHIEKYELEARDTKLGSEEITRDIPNVGEDALRNLDEFGIVRIGAEVAAEDILVGKVAPKGQGELTAEERLVIAIFGKKAEETKDASLRLPHGEKGRVVDVKVYARFKYRCSQCNTPLLLSKKLEEREAICRLCGNEMVREAGDELAAGVNQLVQVYVAQKRPVMEGDKMAGRHGNKGVISKILPVEDMPYLADGTPVDVVLNPLGVPSRMNIGQILETHLGMVGRFLGIEEGFTNPIFEGQKEEQILVNVQRLAYHLRNRMLHEYCTLDLRATGIEGFEGIPLPPPVIETGDIEELESPADRQWMLTEREKELHAEMLAQVRDTLRALSAQQQDQLAAVLALNGEAWPAGGSAAERADRLAERIDAIAEERAGVSADTAKFVLYDGKTGQKFDQPVTVGYAYIMKLLHLVEDKIHARSTGPYSLITQQPLGGKAQFGGQRFGEMEVWALEAYGSAYTLQEILTIKSDDVMGRVKTYESIVKGEPIMEPGIPESFKILVKELQSLGLSVSVETDKGKPFDLRDTDEEYSDAEAERQARRKLRRF